MLLSVMMCVCDADDDGACDGVDTRAWEGVDVYFDCLVSANPAPKSKLVTWLHNVSIFITIFLTLHLMKNDWQTQYIMILVAQSISYFLLRVC